MESLCRGNVTHMWAFSLLNSHSVVHCMYTTTDYRFLILPPNNILLRAGKELKVFYLKLTPGLQFIFFFFDKPRKRVLFIGFRIGNERQALVWSSSPLSPYSPFPYSHWTVLLSAPLLPPAIL